MFCAIFIFQTRSRACLKKAFRELRFLVYGRSYPNGGGVAGYSNRMRVKYAIKWGLQIAEIIFQTRSKLAVAVLTSRQDTIFQIVYLGASPCLFSFTRFVHI